VGGQDLSQLLLIIDMRVLVEAHGFQPCASTMGAVLSGGITERLQAAARARVRLSENCFVPVFRR